MLMPMVVASRRSPIAGVATSMPPTSVRVPVTHSSCDSCCYHLH